MGKNRAPEDRLKAFGAYADFYDALYADKDYAGEAAFVLGLTRYGDQTPKSLLDVGCGTGRHVIEFARSGIEVTGFDVSRQMIRLAKERIARAGQEEGTVGRNLPAVRVGDVRSFKDPKEYDCVVSMFAVMGYLTTNDDLLAGLGNIRRHLKKGGLFIFDVWFGPAVLTEKPETRVKEFNVGETRTVRMAVPEPLYLENVVAVHYHLLQSRGREIVSDVRETHRMRFFFIPELQFFLRQSGFTILRTCPFMEPGREPTGKDWNIAVVAKAL